ncbi:hypothetical protein BKA82DRAFT_4015462 [Pisolithus tinctorius]|nr:hypothetical protein BKA82DRAFT_4015462 [Pisolithus tinctorius]
MVVDHSMVMVAMETKEVEDEGELVINHIPNSSNNREGKAKAQANELDVPGQGAEEFNLTSIEEIPENYPSNDFDITAIEYSCPQSPEYFPAPESVETVMSPDMEITLGQHTIVASHVPSPELTQDDITMAMEHVGYVPSLPIQPDGTLSDWYQEEIQNSFVSEVEMGISLQESKQQETTDPLSRTIPFPSSEQRTWLIPGPPIQPEDGVAVTNVVSAGMAGERNSAENGSQIVQGHRHFSQSS